MDMNIKGLPVLSFWPTISHSRDFFTYFHFVPFSRFTSEMMGVYSRSYGKLVQSDDEEFSNAALQRGRLSCFRSHTLLTILLSVFAGTIMFAIISTFSKHGSNQSFLPKCPHRIPLFHFPMISIVMDNTFQ